MGLKSGERGVKAWLKEKHAAQFCRFDTLTAARDGVPSAREHTAILLDGNVLMNAVPESVCTLGGIADVIFGYVWRDALAAGKLVVVVFDEPAHLTYAKREEQARRDATRKAKTVTSLAEPAPPLPHDFTRADLEACGDISVLKTDRRFKARLYDEVIRRVFARVKRVMAQWQNHGHEPGILVLDGVEPRGCELPNGEARSPVMCGTDVAVSAALTRTVPIGEGDLKLVSLENKLRDLKTRDPRFEQYRLCITSTIDTDALPIMLLDVAKRRLAPSPVALQTRLCMREPPSKRAREETDGQARATFLTVDIVLLDKTLQCHFWSESASQPTAAEMLQSMLALSSAMAVCGCDFTGNGQKGSRFDHFYESLPKFVANEPRALATFDTALASEPAAARQACEGLLRVCRVASTNMEVKPMGGGTRTYTTQASQVRSIPKGMLRRAVWTSAYWAQNEFDANLEWGFQPELCISAA